MNKLNLKLVSLQVSLLFMILSCINRKNELDQTIHIKDANELKIENLTEKIKNDSSILLINSIEREFSNPKTADKFTVSIIGKNLLEGEMIFKITNSDGRVLLNEKYPSSYLINQYALDENSTDKEKENDIRKRVTEFFTDDKFLTPAINDNELFDSDYSDKTIWSDVKSDSTSIGFYYLIGLETGCKIAFSKKNNKIVKYFCCC
jgi:hypothetical protein